MGAWIQGQQDREQHHQEQLNQRVRCTSCEPQQRLKSFQIEALPQSVIQLRQARLTAQQVGHLADQLRQIPSQLLKLADQFRHQQLPQQHPGQDQNPQYGRHGLGALQWGSLLNLNNQHIQGYGHHHGAKEHQQHPTQVPEQQHQHHQGECNEKRAGGHRTGSRRFQRSNTSWITTSRMITCSTTAKGSAISRPRGPNRSVNRN